jgi:1,2-diacylglycerol 3-beta-glucosyltransferase
MRVLVSADIPEIASAVGTGGALAYALLGVAVGALAAYQLALAVAAFFYRPASAPGATPSRAAPNLAVLVPAHNEASVIARCVSSLSAQMYERQYEVVVVADNCSDDTAAIARRSGSRVLVRDEPESSGKGHALRWAFERLLADPRLDAVVVVDADAVADPEFLALLVRRYEAGAAVVQGESLVVGDGSRRAALREAAFLLVNRVRPAGRAALGLSSDLAGNGTLFTREVLEAHPWDAFTGAEDVEFSMKLRHAGVRTTFAGGAVVRSPVAPTTEAMESQRLRWEGGKLHVACTQVPRLIARGLHERRPALFDAALELAMPPLGLLSAAAALGAATGAVLFATGTLASWTLVPWALSLLLVPAYVLLGLRAAHAPRSAYRALVFAPLFVAHKALTTHRLLRFRPDSWVRTERAHDATSPR